MFFFSLIFTFFSYSLPPSLVLIQSSPCILPYRREPPSYHFTLLCLACIDPGLPSSHPIQPTSSSLHTSVLTTPPTPTSRTRSGVQGSVNDIPSSPLLVSSLSSRLCLCRYSSCTLLCLFIIPSPSSSLSQYLFSPSHLSLSLSYARLQTVSSALMLSLSMHRYFFISSCLSSLFL